MGLVAIAVQKPSSGLFPNWLLLPQSRHRNDDYHCDCYYGRGSEAAESDPTFLMRFRKSVPESSAQRTREDVRAPEENAAREFGKEVQCGYHGYEPRKDQRSTL